MARRLGRTGLGGEDERRIQFAQRMFGYAFRLHGKTEPETLEEALTAAREILARPVTRRDPPAGTDPFYIQHTDWESPPKAVRQFARQLVDAVEQAPADRVIPSPV